MSDARSVFALLTALLPIDDLPPSTSRPTEPAVVEFGSVDVDPQDLPAAIREGDAARSAARRVLALPAVQFEIVETEKASAKWGDLSPAGRPTYVWRFRKDSSRIALPPPAYLLRHEIGHDLFIRYLVPSTKNDQYGGDAPDWLDEMAAVAFEGDELRKVRRQATVRYAKENKLIPFRRFLSMIHPEWEARSIPADAQMTAFGAASDQTAIFYAMASAFYDFLVARTENTAIIAELAAPARSGESLQLWILARTGRAGQKEGIDKLDAEFTSWIAADPRYGGMSHA